VQTRLSSLVGTAAALVAGAIALTASMARADHPIHGLVYRDADRDGLPGSGEPGIEGAVVACGIGPFVVTDARGQFDLPACPGGIAWVRVPDGYRPGPAWQRVQDGRDVELGLVPRTAPAALPLTIAVAADTHLHKEQRYFGASDLASVVDLVSTAAPTPAFFTVLGDITQGGDPRELELVDGALANLAVPWVPVPGNHDWYDKGVGWHRHWGPDNYSFDLGGAHFVVWNMSQPEDDIRAFLAGDLAHVDPAMTIVALTHAPPSDAISDLLRSLGATAVLTGHTHSNRVVDHGGLVELVTEPLLMGGLDFTPAGYRIVTIEDHHVRSRHETVVAAPRIHPWSPLIDGACVRATASTAIASVESSVAITDVTARVDCGEPIELAPAGGWTWTGVLPAARTGGHQLELEAIDARGDSVIAHAGFAVCDGSPTSSAAPPPLPSAALARARTDAIGGHVLTARPLYVNGLAIVATTDLADGQRGGLVAISERTGRERWRVTTPVPVRGQPAAAGDVVVATTIDGVVLAIDVRDGRERWRYRLAPKVPSEARATFAGPTIDAAIVYAGNQRELVALDLATGAPRWSVVPVPDGANTQSAAPVAIAGDLVVGTFDRELGGILAWDKASGAPRWQLQGETIAVNAGPIADASSIYVVDGSDQLSALDLRGLVRWRVKLDAQGFDWGNATIGTPALADGILIVPTLYRDVIAIDAKTGAVRWRFAGRASSLRTTHYRGAGAAGFAGAPLVQGGLVWVVDTSGVVSALDLATGVRRGGIDLAAPVLAGPTATANGLVVASFDGALHWLVADTARSHAPPIIVRDQLCPVYVRRDHRVLVFALASLACALAAAALQLWRRLAR